MKKFPKIKSVQYERISPNWKVKVGKFRTKLESEKLKRTIILSIQIVLLLKLLYL